MRALSALPAPLLILLASIKLPPVRADNTPHVDIETTTAVSCSRPSKNGDRIAVHYIGTLESTGEEFDQSYKRGKPIELTLGSGQVIQGWEEGLLDMCPGEGRRLTIPPELAYGEFGRPPVIPGRATLVFETELVDIIGVKQESLSVAVTSEAATTTEEAFSIATAPPTPPEDEDKAEVDNSTPTLEGHRLTAPSDAPTAEQQGECHLLGSFALIVQGALGLVALLSLVYKRWRETPKRPWRIWFFDVSKQVIGSMLTHVLNLAMSMLGAVDMINNAQKAASNSAEKGGGEGGKHEPAPNPCSFYLLNLGIDTTLGIPILYLLLKILHVAFAYTPLARPPQSIKSGHYGQPPKTTWWLKQSLIYFIGLTGMKLFVFFLFSVLPWLPWVGDWALRWTEGNEALQIAFAMFVFPLAMNMVQYWLIDNFIMDKQRGKEGAQGYHQVQNHDDDGDDGVDEIADDDDADTEVGESVRGKGSGDEVPPLTEINPTPIPPIPNYEEVDGRREEASRNTSPEGEGGVKKVEDGTRSI